MANDHLLTKLGPLQLATPLIAASGTVGSVWEWAEVADVSHYGGAVAKSVAPEAWAGRPAPRLAPTNAGLLNGIGIQNPGIEAWVETTAPKLASLGVPVWGSSVAESVDGYAEVAKRMESAGVAAIEINLSCPNLEDGVMFSFDPAATSAVVEAVTTSVTIPVGAKLSPNTPDLVSVAMAARDAGSDFVVLTNTALGFGLDVRTRRPLLSGGVGGYSGVGLKPVALRCVYEVAGALPGYPIVGCGGVSSGRDMVEFLMAGASAVAAGTVHLAEPNAGKRIIEEFDKEIRRLGVKNVTELVGVVERP